MSPPRKDPITNKDSNRITTQQDPICPPLLVKWPTRYKPFIDDKKNSNKTEGEHNDSTNNSHTENKYSVNILNVKNDEEKDYEYKEDN